MKGQEQANWGIVFFMAGGAAFLLGLPVIVQAVQGQENVKELKEKEFPLDKQNSIEYQSGIGEYAKIEVLASEYKGAWLSTRTFEIPIANIDVLLRDDKKEYTSIRFSDKRDHYGERWDKATILVPVAEDVLLWQKEIDRFKKMREDYLKSLPRPTRVLPRDHHNDEK